MTTASSTSPADPATLAGLIAAVALGDRHAYRRLYDATSPKLFAVALRMLREESRAEDVLQDSFVNVWNGAAGYNASLSAPMTWMVTIVRNRALDYIRRVDPRTVEFDDDLEAVLESDSPTPADLAMRSQDATALQGCLKRLDAGQRQAIAFAYFQGLTHSELAATMKIPIGTVKTWIRRGLEKMRRCLDGLAV
ncbi:MAG: sigma-70 family RNA polymerase sigma factor [Burkholderiaceae bacterium]